jgi:excisionase family DNA binding protein
MALLLNVEEAAVELGISRAKVWELIRDERLASVKIDGSRRIRRTDIEAFVTNLCQPQRREASA